MGEIRGFLPAELYQSHSSSDAHDEVYTVQQLSVSLARNINDIQNDKSLYVI